MHASPPDWTDEVFRTRLFTDLRTKVADMNAAARDMLRPPRERELGPVKHRELYEDASGAVEEMLSYALGEPGKR